MPGRFLITNGLPQIFYGESSNGRTAVFGIAYIGSNPVSPTLKSPEVEIRYKTFLPEIS